MVSSLPHFPGQLERCRRFWTSLVVYGLLFARAGLWWGRLLILIFSIVIDWLYCEPCFKYATQFTSFYFQFEGRRVLQIHLPATPHRQVLNFYDANFLLCFVSGEVSSGRWGGNLCADGSDGPIFLSNVYLIRYTVKSPFFCQSYPLFFACRLESNHNHFRNSSASLLVLGCCYPIPWFSCKCSSISPHQPAARLG